MVHIIVGIGSGEEIEKKKKLCKEKYTELSIFTPYFKMMAGEGDRVLKRLETFEEILKNDRENKTQGPIFISDLFERVDEGKQDVLSRLFRKIIPYFENRQVYIAALRLGSIDKIINEVDCKLKIEVTNA